VGPPFWPAQRAAAGPAAPVAAQRAVSARCPGANALVISASADTQRMLAEVIRQLAQRSQQVLIEAIVVELSDNAVRELGVQWLLAELVSLRVECLLENRVEACTNEVKQLTFKITKIQWLWPPLTNTD
jgi:type II secretory pathway component HofQ